MSNSLIDRPAAAAVPVVPVDARGLSDWLSGADEPTRGWVAATGFEAGAETICLVPGGDGTLAAVLAGVGDADDPFALGALPGALPPGDYHLDADWPAPRLERAAIGWALGAYRFTRYRDNGRVPARLVIPRGCDPRRVRAISEAIFLTRDLVNTPAADMMPGDLSAAFADLAGRHGARFREVVGDDLLAQGYPAIHAVGRASSHAPRLLEIEWGEPDRPGLALVGKGVCFDSGGLDLKTAAGMRLMKKDMGGAAHVGALAGLVMELDLPVSLHVLVPAVENAVSGNAYRPGDVVATRKGLSVEVDNTDAEGRVVLCDALAEAASRSPDLIVDFATLTGAARVALGTDLPAMFTNDDAVAASLADAAAAVRDPVWRMPLHAPYRSLIESRIADVANAGSAPYAGAITAALFLQSFVPEDTAWVHFDVMAWNIRKRPGRPEGGEAMGVRATLELLERRYRPV